MPTDAAAPPPVASPWVDHHLVLNGLALLRHRLESGAGDALALMDAVSGYYATGLYIAQRRAAVPLERFFDWFECLAALRGFVSSGGPTWAVEPFEDDSRAPARLGLLPAVAGLIFEHTPAKTRCTVDWKRCPTGLQLRVSPDLPTLRDALGQLAPQLSSWHSAPDGATCVRIEFDPS